MPNLTLYHAAPSRSSIALWMLEEVGAPYDVKLVKLSQGDNLKPDYLAINPMGKVPALKHGDAVITEVAAICAYLADEFPANKLNVPVGTPRRRGRMPIGFRCGGPVEQELNVLRRAARISLHVDAGPQVAGDIGQRTIGRIRAAVDFQ